MGLMVRALEAWSRHSCGSYGLLILNQNMNAKSNKIEPIHDINIVNGWDFGDNIEREEGSLFAEELLEYHKEKTGCGDPLAFLDSFSETVFMALFCPVVLLVIGVWGPLARRNENCYGHEYFADKEESLRRPCGSVDVEDS